MIDLRVQKNHFKNHVAKFTDYGNIKILDFKAPNTSEYRIRFLFEDDYCRLHISGDLGELTATNYKNMTFDGFSDFVNNVEYFKGKIDCHNRPIYTYDSSKARKDIKEYLEERDLVDDLLEETYEEDIDSALDEVLDDFDERTGIGKHGYDILSEIYTDVFEYVDDFGKESTGILDLYMLAFKLAMEQVESRKENVNGDDQT